MHEGRAQDSVAGIDAERLDEAISVEVPGADAQIELREPACNVALYTPDALRSRKHRNPLPGVCDTRYDEVSFRYGDAVRTFPRTGFLVDGRLPIPA